MKKIFICISCLIALVLIMVCFFPVYSSPQKPVASYEELSKELSKLDGIVLPRSDSMPWATEYLVQLDGRSRLAKAKGYSLSGVSDNQNERIFRTRACDENELQLLTEELDSGQNDIGVINYKEISIRTSVTDIEFSENTGRITLWNQFSLGNYTYYFSDTCSVFDPDNMEITEQYIEIKANDLLRDSYQIIDDYMKNT